jgi:hypothetical protein
MEHSPEAAGCNLAAGHTGASARRAPQDFPRRSRCAKRVFHSSPIVSNATNSACMRHETRDARGAGDSPFPLRVSLRRAARLALLPIGLHVYTDWDIEQLAETLLEAVDE